MRKVYIIAAALLALGIFAWDNVAEEAALEGRLEEECGVDVLQPSIAGKILRFHILANSDGDADQRVKKEVRDAVGYGISPLLAEAESLDETEAIAKAHLDEIVDTAEAVLKENGFSYGARASLVTTEFPEKSYGPYTFPAGTYRALEITLGAGEGHNWWCVLYPNMCFQGTVYEVTDNGEALREVLSPAEYADVFNSKDYEIRLKFLEYFR